MKIAMITTWFPPTITGSGNRLYEIGKRLSNKHEIHIYTVGIKGLANEDMMDGMHIHRFNMLEGSKSVEKEYHMLKLKFSYNLLKNIQKDFDIIVCNVVSKPLAYITFFASKSMSAPLILIWHEVWYDQNFKMLNPLMALPGFILELFIPKLADFNIAVSETTKKRLVDLLKVNPKKIEVISNGIDLKKFNEISIKKKKGRIIFVGRLENHKRVDVLMLAYSKLKKKHSNIELIIIGKGQQKRYLLNLSEELSLKDVRFCDPMPYDNLITIMKSSWILVLPSIREGQGIVLLEAMASGTPPIAINVKGSAVGEVVLNNYNGLLVLEHELERAIEKLLTKEKLYKSLQKNGLDFVKNYDWDTIAETEVNVYEQARKLL